MHKSEKIVSFILFTSVFIIYAYCAPKTISFWDSSEFITSSYNLQASHPPGSPFYTMFCAFVLQFSPITKVALVSNLISCLFGALTVSTLFHVTYFITYQKAKKKEYKYHNLLPYYTGLASALTLAFCNSFWVASTETEVYTLSFFLMLLLFYIAIRWEASISKESENKLQLLFALVLGMSVGVHLIILSIIIPISILFTIKKYGLTVKHFFISIFISTTLFFTIYLFLIQGVLNFSNYLDIYLVNKLHFEVNSGAIFALILLMLSLLLILFYTIKKKYVIVHNTVLALTFFIIGMSTYIMPFLRSDAASLVTNGTNTSKRMLNYIQGSQFGINKIPLIKGYTYNAPLDVNNPFSSTPSSYCYNKETKKYEITHNGEGQHVNYSNDFSMIFPRLYDPNSSDLYNLWVPIHGENVKYPVHGEISTIKKPTFKENLYFFMSYQIYWLNLRYLFWNFIGKQNNNHGLGYAEDGNWISGFNFVDKHLVGDAKLIPKFYKEDKSKNYYYFIPFILGIIGLFSLKNQPKYFWVTLLIFLAFGLGITLYINPTPKSILVRERDYIFIGSFIIFSLWVGLSIEYIYLKVNTLIRNKNIVSIIGVLIILIAPLQMFAKGWDNQQRKHDVFSYELAKSYLDSCPNQAILITNGDNMSFPLWYLQEVEKYRTDVRVLNYDQLNLDNYIKRVSKKHFKSEPIKIDIPQTFFNNGVDKLIPLKEDTKQSVELDILFKFLKNSNTKVNWNNQIKNYIPSTSFELSISKIKKGLDSIKAVRLNATSKDYITWSYSKKFYGINDIVLLNIIKNNYENRRIFFLDNSKKNHYIGLENFLIKRGLVNEFSGIRRINKNSNPKIVDTDATYSVLMEKGYFEGLNTSQYVTHENKVYAQTILRQNYYFLAQALYEEKEVEKAYKVLNRCETLFPNYSIPYKQYSFAIGKLYLRMGYKQKGLSTCTIAINNIWDELNWITSFQPQNPIINVRHAEKKYKVLTEMIKQITPIKKEIISENDFIIFTKKFMNWKKENWPY
jgi:hypothetical protein